MGLLDFFKKDECENHYKFGKTLGSGSFATVKLATKKDDNTQWAVKIINMSALGPEDDAMLENEVAVLNKVKHPNIVSLHQNFKTHGKFYMVMEICKGGELFDRIVEKETYNEAEARKAVVDIASALDYIHQQNIVHRDLKPENLLYRDVDTEVLKLADFGLALILEPQTALTTACGTPGYVAPEILMGHGYDKEVDLWSLGVITYILLCGYPPFYDDNNADLFNQIMRGEYQYLSPYWDKISDEAKNLIDCLLVLDPSRRYTAADVLNHPWITSPEGQTEHLEHFKGNMVRYNARRKFRAGIMSLQVLNFMAKGSVRTLPSGGAAAVGIAAPTTAPMGAIGEAVPAAAAAATEPAPAAESKE